MMANNIFDAKANLEELAQTIDMLPEEVEAVGKRIAALAVATVPPDWGYVGMLKSMSEVINSLNNRALSDVFDVYRMIGYWRNNPSEAEHHFRLWNAARLCS